MSTFSCFSSPKPVSTNMLVAFFDMTNYTRVTRNPEYSDEDIYAFLSDYFEFVGSIVEPAGGKILKFIGDAVLIVFSEEDVDKGVQTLKRLKDEGDRWLEKRGLPCRNMGKVHFGPVAAGLLGSRENKHPDIIGATVNTTALLPSQGLTLSAQVFRKLSKETRTLFKKHTPPIIYIPVEERHKDPRG